MYTEAEAKTKLCPFIRYGESIPDVMAATRPQLCVASECMAWRVSATGIDLSEAKQHLAADRWIEAIRSFRAATGATLKDSKDFLLLIRDGEREWPIFNAKGFCGAAGTPKAGAA
jgi:hypothetical protein